MDFQGLLNQFLNTTGQSNNSTPNQSSTSSSSNPMLSGLASGAISGSLMGMLMGSKKGRKMGKSALKIGGAAAVGMLALKAYQNWQQNNQGQTQQAPAQPESSPAMQQLTAPDETNSKLLLKAMIGAAKADGHVDEEERQRIQQGVQQAGATVGVNQFVETELAKPLDPSDIASGVTSPELAAEMYLVSVLMVDEQNFMEKSYLQELARQLNIAPDLAQQLEQQVAAN